MAESCRKVEKAPKVLCAFLSNSTFVQFADLVTQLEKMKVADHALPCDLLSGNEVIENIEDKKYETQCETEDQEAENSNTLATPTAAHHTVKTQESPSQLYPRLDPEVPEEIGTEPTAASAPLSENINSGSPPFECSLPSPMTMDCLKNLYVNHTLDNIDSIELEFLKASLSDPCYTIARICQLFLHVL